MDIVANLFKLHRQRTNKVIINGFKLQLEYPINPLDKNTSVQDNCLSVLTDYSLVQFCGKHMAHIAVSISIQTK